MTTLTRKLLFFLLLALLPMGGEAATFQLQDGKTMEGEILHYYRGILTIRTTGGKEIFLGENEIHRIDFGKLAPVAKRKTLEKTSERPAFKNSNRNFLQGLSKNESKFATPTRTFETWLKSATEGDLDSMVKCYASFRKREVKKELKKYSREIRERMRSSTAETKFIPGEPFYQGDRATLEINWQKGVQGDSQILQFILEGEDWKIIR